MNGYRFCSVQIALALAEFSPLLHQQTASAANRSCMADQARYRLARAQHGAGTGPVRGGPCAAMRHIGAGRQLSCCCIEVSEFEIR